MVNKKYLIGVLVISTLSFLFFVYKVDESENNPIIETVQEREKKGIKNILKHCLFLVKG